MKHRCLWWRPSESVAPLAARTRQLRAGARLGLQASRAHGHLATPVRLRRPPGEQARGAAAPLSALLAARGALRDGGQIKWVLAWGGCDKKKWRRRKTRRTGVELWGVWHARRQRIGLGVDMACHHQAACRWQCTQSMKWLARKGGGLKRGIACTSKAMVQQASRRAEGLPSSN